MNDDSLHPADLVGGYTIVAGERFGRPEPTDRVYGSTVRFTESTVAVTDRTKKETYAATYTLEPGPSPCRITMTATAAPNAGAVAHGLIEKAGNAVRLIYSLPGTEPPADFRTGPGQLMFELRNLNA